MRPTTDTIHFTCHSCGKTITLSTTRGPGAGISYHITELPFIMESYYHNTLIKCNHCEASHLIKLNKPKRVILKEHSS